MTRPRTEPDHGSCSGYQRHKLAGEQACADCLEAWRDYHRAYQRLRARLRRRQKEGGGAENAAARATPDTRKVTQ